MLEIVGRKKVCKCLAHHIVNHGRKIEIDEAGGSDEKSMGRFKCG